MAELSRHERAPWKGSGMEVWKGSVLVWKASILAPSHRGSWNGSTNHGTCRAALARGPLAKAEARTSASMMLRRDVQGWAVEPFASFTAFTIGAGSWRLWGWWSTPGLRISSIFPPSAV